MDVARKLERIALPLAIFAQRNQPFEIAIHGCGFFPNTRRPSVLWAGVVSEKIAEVQQDVERLIAPLGFPAEKREFSNKAKSWMSSFGPHGKADYEFVIEYRDLVGEAYRAAFIVSKGRPVLIRDAEA